MLLAAIRYLVLGATVLLANLASPALAQWTVQSSVGTVLILKDSRWVELGVGQALEPPFTLRTLRGAKVQMTSPGTALALGGGAVSMVTEDSSSVRIDLISGALSALSTTGRPVFVTAAGSSVLLEQGEAEVSLSKQGAAVRSRNGKVTVESGGTTLALEPGQSSASPGGNPPSLRGGPPTVEIPGDPAPGSSGNGGGNGGGNGSGNGNGGENGSSGGNGNGNGGGNGGGKG